MKRTMAILILVLFLIPIVNAEVFNMKRFQVYVDGKEQEDVGWDGGEIIANPGSEVKFKFWLENVMDAKMEWDAKVLILDIDDGDDISKTTSGWISNLNNERATITISIPMDAVEDNYETWFELNTEAGSNSSDEDVRFDLMVEEDIEAKEKEYQTQFSNMTAYCSAVLKQYASLINYVNNSIKCETELSSLQTKFEYISDNMLELNNDYNKTYTEKGVCQDELTRYKNVANNYETEMRNMIYKSICDKNVSTAFNQGQDDAQGDMLWVGAGAVAVWYFGFYRKKKGTEHPADRMERSVL